jgi:hypothetical protein
MSEVNNARSSFQALESGSFVTSGISSVIKWIICKKDKWHFHILWKLATPVVPSWILVPGKVIEWCKADKMWSTQGPQLPTETGEPVLGMPGGGKRNLWGLHDHNHSVQGLLSVYTTWEVFKMWTWDLFWSGWVRHAETEMTPWRKGLWFSQVPRKGWQGMQGHTRNHQGHQREWKMW